MYGYQVLYSCVLISLINCWPDDREYGYIDFSMHKILEIDSVGIVFSCKGN